jgi:diguanylate cyclase (GGDEF)-like protein
MPHDRSDAPRKDLAAECAAAAAGGPTPGVGSHDTGDAGKLRVLVVDDEPSLRLVVGQVLSLDGHDVTVADSAEEGIALFRATPFPLVITDVVMGRMSGLDLLREVKRLDPEALVVIMTSQASLETATTALREGAYDFLVKPFEDLVLVSAVANRALDKLALQARNRLLTQQLGAYTEELERLTRSLKERADRDGLTDLYNVRCFRQSLDEAILGAIEHGRAFSLILLDVDHFKHYNDTHGHLAGDELLKELAALLQESCGPRDLCARYGGEEFVVLVPGATRPDAAAYAEKLRVRVENHPFVGRESQPSRRVTISVGLSCCPDDGEDHEALIGRADYTLYQAKRKGRNTVHC